MTDIDIAPLPDGPSKGFTIPLAARTTRLFKLLAVATTTIAAVLPLAVVLYWSLVDAAEIERLGNLAAGSLASFSALQRLGAALITVLTILPLSWGLVRLRVCFAEFAKGRPFAARGIAGLRDFATGMVGAALAKLIGFTLLTLVLTWNAPAGHRQLAIQINSDMLLMALFAATIAALGWAMQKAAAVAEENSQFV